MGSLYRSEEMCLCQLFLQTESAFNCIAELGELGMVQFRDLNVEVNSYQRKFVDEIRRCAEMERKLRYLQAELQKDAIEPRALRAEPDTPLMGEMGALEEEIGRLQTEVQEVNVNENMLKHSYLELIELKHVLRNTTEFFDENIYYRNRPAASRSIVVRDDDQRLVETDIDTDSVSSSVPSAAALGRIELEFLAGMIPIDRLPAFQTMLWRACLGNVFLRKAEVQDLLEDPFTGVEAQKAVFVVFFQGTRLKSRVRKICQAFHASIYPCPSSAEERRQVSLGVMSRLEDLKIVLKQTWDHRTRVLEVAAIHLGSWTVRTQKLKAVLHTINLFNLDVTQKCFIAECWVPTAEIEPVKAALRRGTEASESTVPSILNRIEADAEPPTYHKTNKFTRAFQNIVDSYGVANYREANPAPYLIISYPFLFAVMFGDAGHGLIMLILALLLVLPEKRIIRMDIQDEIFNMFFTGRYIILLMAIFSIYTGLIYNDFFAKSLNIFGSTWKNPYPFESMFEARETLTDLAAGSTSPSGMLLTMNPEFAFQGDPYVFGIDPIWNLATNKLNFLNTFKMKLSVILGITQMTFGLFLSLANYWNHRSTLDVIGVFIPQLIFLSSIFIYLCVQIFYKWAAFYVVPKETWVGVYPGSNCAPSLLVGLINMFMFTPRPSGFVTPDKTNSSDFRFGGQAYSQVEQCSVAQWYPYQSTIEALLVILAVVCIPWMLFLKPFVLRSRHKKAFRDGYSLLEDGDAIDDGKPATIEVAHGNADAFNFSDMFVLQVIHTIEFCLGCISHTASYLRLWALSLAHSQLSEVLWTMLLRGVGMQLIPGPIGGVLLWYITIFFLVLTFGILLLMEGLSAFLHALRLHWVEFQSKFYHGEGYAFKPFSFARFADDQIV